ncbi:hypothetical protein HK097_005040 [Rhizophlyctis rosea]|uniref:Nicotinamide-nucleotide adenylyltransferase n=1 Tax=Rhizophlyctis rosea TaxID=64517 RepID=A0AAD5X5N9_9FUNG|nr:hypothetical protein HK097_005040 [Rhizophlyctis rosea]
MSSRKDAIQKLLAQVKPFQPNYPSPPPLSFHTPSTSPPFPSTTPLSSPLNILILDSSYNPPTTAHLSLLQSSLSHLPQKPTQTLLTFSPANADKSFSPSHLPTRLTLISLLADTFSLQNPQTPTQTILLSKPYFKDKANELLLHYRQISRSQSAESIRLWFILGYDTLIRFFDPKYYKEIDMTREMEKFFEKGRIVCANRVVPSTSPSSPPQSVQQNASRNKIQEQEGILKQFMDSSDAASLIARFKDRIFFLPEWLDSEVAGVSSTLVRGLLKEYWHAKTEGTVEEVKELEGRLRELVPAGVVDFVLEEGLYKD